MKKNLVFTMLVAASVFSFSQAQSVRLEVRLGGIAKGKAKWQTRDTTTERQAELQVEGENLRPNTNYWVLIGTNPAWAVRTNGFGTFRLARTYRQATRPTIPNGSYVMVRNAAGVSMMSGVLRPRP